MVEFTTGFVPSPYHMREKMAAKVKKYTPLVHILESQGIRVKLDVVVVSKQRVISTIALTKSICQGLCQRYIASFASFETIKASCPELREFFLSEREKTSTIVDMRPVMEQIGINESFILSRYKKCCSKINTCYFDESAFIKRVYKEHSKLNETTQPLYRSVRDLVEPGGRIDHDDAVSRFPLAIPFETLDNFRLSGAASNLSSCLPINLYEIWSQCLPAFVSDPDRFQAFSWLPGQDIELFCQRVKAITKEQRNERGKITLSLSKAAKEELALRGVLGKKLRFAKFMKMRREETQKHFHPDSNIQDIQDFVDSFPDRLDSSTVSHQETSLSLLSFATPESKWKPMDTYDKMKDNVYDMLVFLADLNFELAASAAHSCKSKDFILKKMSRWDAFLVIKPTKSQEHTFFSLMMRTRNDLHLGRVFPRAHKCGDYQFYDFRSVNLASIECLIRLPECYLGVKYIAQSRALLKNLAMGLLMALDGKSDAEEVVTKSRYMYMKATQIPWHARNPWIVLEGLPSRPRSRLTLFLLHRCVCLVPRLSDMKITEISDEEDKWENIPNLVSDDLLSNWEDVLQVIYTGYFRNKNAFSSSNQFMAMLEKIVKPEMELQEDEAYHDAVLKGNSMSPKKMEWNSGFLELCVDRWLIQCSKNGMPEVKKYVTEEFLNRLSKVHLDELATLKASNVDLVEKEFLENSKNMPREKLVTVVHREVSDFGETMADALPVAIQKIADRGGSMMISLFKKAQHGGLREIYVMDLASRVVQYSLEVLGRVLCDTLPHEAMTHLAVKNRYRQEHSAKVQTRLNILQKKCSEVKSFTLFDNDDAEKWNQYHHVQKFAKMLEMCTEEILHPYIRVGLSQWMNKRIRMDYSMCKSMKDNVYIPSSPVAKYIRDGFIGEISSEIAKPHMMDLRIESGMMQGLLHFVSSALHALCMLGFEYMKLKMISHLKRQIRRVKPDLILEVISTAIVTSDDSICCNTVLTNMNSSQAIVLGSTMCSAVKLVSGMYVGITSSRKKASYGTAPISEFNSQWMDRREVLRPCIRHVLACFTSTCIGNFMEQQDEMASLRQQALESGCSIHHVSFINLLQGLFYYRMAGSCTNAIFDSLTPLFMSLPDPNAGFFMMDDPKFAGIMSVDHSAYNLALKTNLGARYNLCLSEPVHLTGASGSIRSSTSMTIYFNRMTKHKALLETIDHKGVREYMEKHPDLLYRKPKSLEETQMVIAVKLMTAKVLQSMSKDNNVAARQIASSVYHFSAPLVLPDQEFLDRVTGIDIDTMPTKTSIAQLLSKYEYACRYEAEQGRRVLTPLAKVWYFPQHKEFDRLNELSAALESRVEWAHEVEPKTATVIEVIRSQFSDIPLVKCCAFRWFNLKDYFTNESLMEVTWHEVREKYPFLQDTHDETLSASGLSHPIQLRNALDRTEKKGKVIRPTSRGGRAMRSTGLASFISYNFMKGKILKSHGSFEGEDLLKKGLRRISMTLELPISEEKKKELIRSDINEMEYDILRTHPRYSGLCLAHSSLPENLSMTNCLKLCPSEAGAVGSWIQAQKKRVVRGRREWYGHGCWGGIFSRGDDHARVLVNIHDKKVVQIKTDNLDLLQHFSTTLTKLFKNWSCDVPDTHDGNASTHFKADFGVPVGVPVFRGEHPLFPNQLMSEKPELVIRNKLLTIQASGLPLYEFKPRADLIQGGIASPNGPMLSLLRDNLSIPAERLIMFLKKKQTGEIKKIQDWLVELIGNFVADPQEVLPEHFLMDIADDDDEMPDLIESYQVASSLLTLSEKPPYTDDEGEQIYTAATLDCLGEDDMKLFEYRTDLRTFISPIHFNFFQSLKMYATPVVNRLAVSGVAMSEMEQFVYHLYTGEDLPLYQEADAEDDFFELTY
uniref:RNA-dependent RNA polymerase n=1 Tax=Beihai bunya-like virus 2 TaxID=1922372 RepID=A0A1L3KPD4_9VIRU|nr:RNA-dependent RNA polymerase [Beihai bunya-like virus 2]